jgi:hypothetical protein
MTDPYRRVFDALVAAGWKVRERDAANALSVDQLFPAELRKRYPNVPPELVAFLGRLDECTNAEENEWFLTAADYAGTSDSAFAWNEWEKQELDTFEDDVEETAAIREFWNTYLPFFSDVSGDYAYFAVRVTDPPPKKRGLLQRLMREAVEPHRGAVIHGIEEYRAVTSPVAASFPEFLEHLVNTLRDPGRETPLSGRI